MEPDEDPEPDPPDAEEPDEPDDELDEPEPDEPEPDEPEPDDPSPDDEPPSFPPSDVDERDALVADEDDPRSFFAQPEPLKWIVGGANCLRSVPSAPHVGQNCGAASLIPWRMSVFVPQFEQTYS